MTLHKPLYLQPAGGDPDVTYTGAEARSLIQAGWPFEGVIDRGAALGQYQVQQRGAGANFSVDILSGAAVIAGDDVAGQGNYLAWNDATFNLATPTAPGSGTRLHRVGLQVRDKLNNGAWSTYDFTPLVVQDTGAGFPAEPNSFLTLAQVSIAAGQASVQTANITDMRAFAGEYRKWRSSDSSARTSTTPVADTVLAHIMSGSATYAVEAVLFWTTSTGHLGISWTRPSGATGRWGGATTAGGGVPINAGYGWSESLSADTASSGGASSGGLFLKGICITGAAAPAPFALNWNSTDGSSTVLKAGSYLAITRIG